jgi:hypothetical protein
MLKLNPDQKQTLEERWNGAVFDEHDLRGTYLQGYAALEGERLNSLFEFDEEGVPADEQAADLVVILSVEVSLDRSGNKLLAKPSSNGEKLLLALNAHEQLSAHMPLLALYMRHLIHYLYGQSAKTAQQLLYTPDQKKN